MLALSRLLAGLALLALALAAPPTAPQHRQSPGTKCGGGGSTSGSASGSASQPEPTPEPTEPWRKWCEKGQLCDCSRIADKNSDE